LKLQKATAEVIKSEVHNINAKKYMYRPSPRMDVFKMNNNMKKFTSFSKEKKNENNPGSSNTDYLSNGKNKNKDKFFNTKCLERFNAVNGNILGNNNNKLITNPNSNTNNSNSNSNTNNLTRDRDRDNNINMNMNINNEAYNNVNSNSNKNLLPSEHRINSGINSGHISLRKSLEFNRERAKTFTNNKEATSISNTGNNLFNHNHNQNIIPSTNNPHNTNTNSNPNSNVRPVVFKKLSKDINSKLSSILATKAKRSESNASASASGSNIKTNE
jgi:hypothetical protein